MVIAIELAEELKRDGIFRAELARRHGMFGARVEVEKILAMGTAGSGGW